MTSITATTVPHRPSAAARPEATAATAGLAGAVESAAARRHRFARIGLSVAVAGILAADVYAVLAWPDAEGARSSATRAAVQAADPAFATATPVEDPSRFGAAVDEAISFAARSALPAPGAGLRAAAAVAVAAPALAVGTVPSGVAAPAAAPLPTTPSRGAVTAPTTSAAPSAPGPGAPPAAATPLPLPEVVPVVVPVPVPAPAAVVGSIPLAGPVAAPVVADLEEVAGPVLAVAVAGTGLAAPVSEIRPTAPVPAPASLGR